MFKTKFPVPQNHIQNCYVAACQLEVRTLKPGNVHIFAEGHGMTVADFDRSAEISAPFVSDPKLSVGTRIWKSVEATINALQTNTNLGIILLCAPIAAAVGPRGGSGETFQKRIAHILESLTHADACEAYNAIIKAKPAGLGNVLEGDVRKAPPSFWTLWDAMKESACHDLIAAQYACYFSDIVHSAGLYQKYLKEGASREEALSFLFLQKLSQIHDTHIVRKQGQECAEWVRKTADQILTKLAVSKAQDLSAVRCQKWLLAFDQELKTKGYNPGSLADMMCAIAFYHHLSSVHS